MNEPFYISDTMRSHIYACKRDPLPQQRPLALHTYLTHAGSSGLTASSGATNGTCSYASYGVLRPTCVLSLHMYITHTGSSDPPASSGTTCDAHSNSLRRVLRPICVLWRFLRRLRRRGLSGPKQPMHSTKYRGKHTAFAFRALSFPR